jgi:hypothetical protein
MIRRHLAFLRLIPLALLLAPLACSSSNGNHDAGNGTTGGTSTGGTGGGFTISTIVPDGGDESQALAIAVSPDDRIGVAYFRRIDCPDGTDNCPERTIQHVPDFEVEYIEVKKNGQASAETKVQQVQLAFGLTVAFQPNGSAAVAYLGWNGQSYSTAGVDGGQYDGTTPAWFQNDAVVSYQQGDGTWRQYTVMQQASDAPVGNIPGAGGLDDNGNILGFWPALAFDSTQAYLAFRDGHFANYACPNPQDWCSATIRFGQGSPPTNWTKSWAVAGDLASAPLEAFGGHNQLLIFNGQPALAFDRMPGGAGELSSGSQDILFAMRQSDGKTWTTPKKVFPSGETQSGPSMAYDSQVGLAIAAVDDSVAIGASKLAYVTSTDGITWTNPDPVVQAGSDGWWPSLAIDPMLHLPHIAYYHCSDTAGVNAPGLCPPSQDELRISHLDPQNNWNAETIDTAGGYLPKIGFFSDGKRFVIYRASVADSSIKLALEN